jgi:hypothetical protein
MICCCYPCVGGDILLQGSSVWGLDVVSGNVEIFGPTSTDFVSSVKQADDSFAPGGTASVKESINTSKKVNITIYRLYNSTGLACNLSSTHIDPSKPEPSTELLINPLLIALNDSNSDIRYRAARALGDIRSTQAIDPLINGLTDNDPKVQDSSESALLKITGMDFGKDQEKWIEWRRMNMDAREQVQMVTGTTSTISLPTYSQILETYPAGTEICQTEAHVTNVTNGVWELVNIKAIHVSNKGIVTQCYGTKITLDEPVTLDGKTFEAGSNLTVDKDLKWIQVSSWD